MPDHEAAGDTPHTTPHMKYRLGKDGRVIATVAGPLKTTDKLKGYYKQAITALGAVLASVNELSPIFNMMPGQDKHYVTVGILAGTALLNFLKSNEQWVDQLP